MVIQRLTERFGKPHLDIQVLDAADPPQVINGFVYLCSGAQWVMPRITVTSLFCISTEDKPRRMAGKLRPGEPKICHQASDTEETVQEESSIYIYLVCMWVCFCTRMCGQHVGHVC